MGLLCLFVAYFKATFGTPFAVATLYDRSFGNLGDESLCQMTDFRMDHDRGCERTTARLNHELVSIVFDFSSTAECFQHFHRAVYA